MYIEKFAQPDFPTYGFLANQNLQPDLLDAEHPYNIALAHYAIATGKRRQLALRVKEVLAKGEQTRFCLLLARAALAWADEQVDTAHAALVAEGSK